MRSILLCITIVITAILAAPYFLLELLVGLFSMKARDFMTLHIMRLEFKLLCFVSGVRLHMTGFENIPKDKAVLYVGNHRSIYDILVTYHIFPGFTIMISKKEWEKIPVMSWWMKLLHNLFLDREDIKQGLKTILTAIDRVKEGYSVCIYPEGTRNKTDEPMLPFHEGSFKIAEKSGCPIIPMTMYNTRAVFEDHFPKVKATDVYLDFGTPIIPEELEKEERKHIGEYTRGIMIETYKKLEKEANAK